LKSIIFICLGNICRSPLAEGVAKAKAKEYGLKIIIKSAGLSTYHNGENPCKVSQNLAKKHGIDISTIVSEHIGKFNLNSFDLIVALDNSNKQQLQKLGYSNVKLLGDFGFNGKDVADLYYHPQKENEVWSMINTAIDKIFNG
jgi:protein-tyrosine phosphatase